VTWVENQVAINPLQQFVMEIKQFPCQNKEIQIVQQTHSRLKQLKRRHEQNKANLLHRSSSMDGYQ